MIEDVEEDISYLESEGGNLSLLASDNISLHCGLDITNNSVRIVQVITEWTYPKKLDGVGPVDNRPSTD